MKLKILIGIACIAIGWLGSTAERSAHAQVSPPTRLGEWKSLGSVNDVEVYSIGSGCFVTVPQGGISCR
jgi:hypothetical protein